MKPTGLTVRREDKFPTRDSEIVSMLKRNRFLLAVLSSLIVVSLVFLCMRFAALPSSYRRFVSAPLPDGTRYTVRYPAWLDGVSSNSNSATFYEKDVSSNSLEMLRRRLIQAAHTREEIVAVGYWPMAQGIPKGRSETRGIRLTEKWHDVHIVDTSKHRMFSLYHRAPSDAKVQFDHTDSMIAQSFQVLAPGTPLPKD